jgi:hypothetical protein
MEEQAKININWSDFEMKGNSEDRFKPEVGKKYLLGGRENSRGNY